ncbi:MAG: hypothetical protein GY851_04755 [bacterium]|nr:hypothetical protein [bacterium]
MTEPADNAPAPASPPGTTEGRGARLTAVLAAYAGFLAFLASGEVILHLLCPT